MGSNHAFTAMLSQPRHHSHAFTGTHAFLNKTADVIGTRDQLLGAFIKRFGRENCLCNSLGYSNEKKVRG